VLLLLLLLLLTVFRLRDDDDVVISGELSDAILSSRVAINVRWYSRRFGMSVSFTSFWRDISRDCTVIGIGTWNPKFVKDSLISFPFFTPNTVESQEEDKPGEEISNDDDDGDDDGDDTMS